MTSGQVTVTLGGIDMPTKECLDNPNGGVFGRHQWAFMLRETPDPSRWAVKNDIFFCQWCLTKRREPAG